MKLVKIILVAAVLIAVASLVSFQNNVSPVANAELYQGKIIRDDLTVVGAAEFYSGPAKGSTTLSLGERVYYSGSGGMVLKPIRCFVAPGHVYSTGQRLNRIPEGSFPVRLFFKANNLFKEEGLIGDYPLFLFNLTAIHT